MASFARSFKPSSYLSSMKRRPPPPARTMSNSSTEASPLSSPDVRQDDIVFSTRPSPKLGMDHPQFQSPGASPKLRATTGRKDPPLFDSPRSTPVRARPIAIELPTAKKVNSAPVYTPPAPLSARGDLPGGYFPLHEEQNRVYRPHPFELDASKARIKSIERAGDSNSLPSERPISTKPAMRAIPSITVPASMPEQSTRLAPSNAASLPRSDFESGSNTPVASYNPTGAQDNPLPMGKYYPSNYVKRKEEKRSKQQTLRPSSSSPVSPVGSKSETQVPTTRDIPAIGHSRNESEAKRRLQQYQRDMIAQATLALNGGNMNAATLNSLRTIGFTSMSNNPSKPRLVPLGSPGPVTPMELEGAEDGYLGARGPADAHIEEIARAIRAEEELKRREGTASPTVELGPSTF
ncbi:hypothetical protein F4818DRAFT_198293 [Hypoxylon cercidicola]|nr:hypothetical protein F4818DRAFT_198293 [Hypoxylon cercidicola]